jgi:hypothetical protein
MSLHIPSVELHRGDVHKQPTPSEKLIALLKSYADDHHYDQLRAIVQKEDWSTLTADEMLQVVDLFLHLGVHDGATIVAQQAAQRYPTHKRVQQAARVLSPGVRGKLRYDMVHPQGLQASREWLQDHARAYRGKWVAVHNGSLVGESETLADLKAIVTEKYALDAVLITKG